MLEERRKSSLENLSRIKNEINDLENQEHNLASEINEKENQLTEAISNYEKALLVIKELAATIDEQKAVYSDSSQMLEENKSQVFEALQEKAAINNQITRLESDFALLIRKKEALMERASKISLDLDSLYAQQSELQKEKNKLAEINKNGQEALLQMQEKQNEGNSTLENIKKEIEKKQLIYQQTFSRLQILEEMEESGEGYQQGVRSILELASSKKLSSIDGIIGTIADIISVPPEFETALETALGGALQYIVTTDDIAAQKAINYLKTEKKGRATFLPLNTIKFTKANIKLDSPEVIGRAVDLIKFDPKYQSVMEHLLGKVWVINNLQALVEVGKKTNFAYRMVTLDGEIITPGGALTGGSYRKQKTGLLARKRLIKELSQELIKRNQEIELTKSNLIEQEQLLEKLSSEIIKQKNYYNKTS